MSTETSGNAVLPFYILCDESGSMDANGGIDAINSGLPELHAAIAGDPLVSDKCRIGLLTFSDIAEELLPLSNLSDVGAMPGCAAKGLTNYGEAFNLLRVVISRDIANLKAQGLQVYRPAVFIITDGDYRELGNCKKIAAEIKDENGKLSQINIILFAPKGHRLEAIKDIAKSNKINVIVK